MMIRLFFFVGNIIKRKNVNSLLEAKKIAKSDYNLVVVGNGPLLKQLKDKAEKKKIFLMFISQGPEMMWKILCPVQICLYCRLFQKVSGWF